MNTNEIQNILLKNLYLKKVYVISDNHHYQIIVIDQNLSKKTKIEQHKTIYTPLTYYITNNIIHSVSINVFSPDEWHKQHHLHKIK